MLKRWDAWPRGSRLTAAGIAAVVLILVVAWVLFVPAADWLARHDVGSVTGSLRETALDDARGQLLTLGAGLFAAGALVFTARNAALLPVRGRVSGSGHPETLTVRANLARWTGVMGDPAGARDQFAALLPLRERVLGPGIPAP